MRGFLQPALRTKTSELQDKCRGLSRHRRTKLAHAAHTTLVKIDQWGRGGDTPAELAGAIERALVGAEAKSKKTA